MQTMGRFDLGGWSYNFPRTTLFLLPPLSLPNLIPMLLFTPIQTSETPPPPPLSAAPPPISVPLLAVLYYTSQYFICWDFVGMTIQDLKSIGIDPNIHRPKPRPTIQS